MHRYVVVDVFTGTPLEGNPAAVVTMRAASRPGGCSGSPGSSTCRRPSSCSRQKAEATRGSAFSPRRLELPSPGTRCSAPRSCSGRRPRTGDQPGNRRGPRPGRLARERRIASGRMRQPVPAWERYEQAGELLQRLAWGRQGCRWRRTATGRGMSTLSWPASGRWRRWIRIWARSPGCPASGPAARGRGQPLEVPLLRARLGVPEDPATGSAAGPLAVHLARHGRIAFGQQIEISQGTEVGRPSRLYACAAGTADRIDSVEVAGAAVIVARGELDA